MTKLGKIEEKSNSSQVPIKEKHPYESFGTATEIYTDMDALRDSLILKIKVFFGQAAKPVPIESYRERFRVDKNTATEMRDSTDLVTHDSL